MAKKNCQHSVFLKKGYVSVKIVYKRVRGWPPGSRISSFKFKIFQIVVVSKRPLIFFNWTVAYCLDTFCHATLLTRGRLGWAVITRPFSVKNIWLKWLFRFWFLLSFPLLGLRFLTRPLTLSRSSTISTMFKTKLLNNVTCIQVGWLCFVIFYTSAYFQKRILKIDIQMFNFVWKMDFPAL